MFLVGHSAKSLPSAKSALGKTKKKGDGQVTVMEALRVPDGLLLAKLQALGKQPVSDSATMLYCQCDESTSSVVNLSIITLDQEVQTKFPLS